MRCKRTGKVSFKTKEQAMIVGVRSLYRSRWKTNLVRAYSCPFCNHWHLTSHADKKQSK